MVPEDYMAYVCRTEIDQANREVLARLALNQLFDVDRYPVRLKEVISLPFEERMRARSFMDYCAIHPSLRSSYPLINVREVLRCLEAHDVSHRVHPVH